MTEVFVIQNQDALFLGRQGEWVDGSSAGAIFRTSYKDEAVNVKVEQSVRDPHLRLQVLTCPTDHKGQPLLDSRHHRSSEVIDPGTPDSFSCSEAAQITAIEEQTAAAGSKFAPNPDIP